MCQLNSRYISIRNHIAVVQDDSIIAKFSNDKKSHDIRRNKEGRYREDRAFVKILCLLVCKDCKCLCMFIV